MFANGHFIANLSTQHDLADGVTIGSLKHQLHAEPERLDRWLAQYAWHKPDVFSELNRGFIKRMEQGMPHVSIKMACSLDGRTALKNGSSQWITADAATGCTNSCASRRLVCRVSFRGMPGQAPRRSAARHSGAHQEARERQPRPL